MLVLSRHRDEKIMIGGGEIVIMIVRIMGDKVRIGIEAPPHVRIDREEVFEDRRNEGRRIDPSPRAPSPCDPSVPPIDVSRRPYSLQEPPHGPPKKPRR